MTVYGFCVALIRDALSVGFALYVFFAAQEDRSTKQQI
jgi:hypothetical protein